jgi:hypothetical protein
MGLYDTILGKCPKCGTESEFQSKSGECLLRNYDLKHCPDDVLLDANRHSPNYCDGCGSYYEIDIKNRKGRLVNL